VKILSRDEGEPTAKKSNVCCSAFVSSREILLLSVILLLFKSGGGEGFGVAVQIHSADKAFLLVGEENIIGKGAGLGKGGRGGENGECA